MTTRIALISDLHANEHALARVLADAHDAGVDGVACLGDVCTLGPRPREVLAMIREHASWFIMGNHDEYMFRPELLGKHSDAPVVVSAVAWCRAALGSADLAFVRTFAARAEIHLGGGAALLLYHGSPDSNTTNLLADVPATTLDRCFGGEGATVFAGGHTHLQMLRQHCGRLVVNPGSVGMPFESFPKGGPPVVMPHAEYAIVEARAGNVRIELRRVLLDRDALIAQMDGYTEEMAGFLLSQYRR